MPENKSAAPNAFDITLFSTKHGKKVARAPFSAKVSAGIPVHEGEVGRLIGILHCQNMIDESRAIRFDPLFSRNYIEQVAREYNIASDYTSLLMLHSAIQFIDNEVCNFF